MFNNIKKEISLLPYPHKAKQSLNNSLTGICSIGLVAIRRLQKIQMASPALPDLKTLSRNKLIIDMEKVTNRWRCVKCYAKLQTAKKGL